MAKTWRKGHFGLENFQSIYTALDDLLTSFNDNLSGNFTDRNQPSDPSYTNISDSSTTFTDVSAVGNPTFTDISDVSNPTFTDISEPSDPNYNDIGRST
tara:strand:+ start:14314 stop:14610 length:297 start_codon:yes stop_codon:yes gene_type:complete